MFSFLYYLYFFYIDTKLFKVKEFILFLLFLVNYNICFDKKTIC